jgi:starch phosphorylase
MKNAMRTICPFFNAYRMVREYTEGMYLPAGQRWDLFSADGLARARALAAWRARVQPAWREVAVQRVAADTVTPLEWGEARTVQAEIALGSLSPGEVSVALYAGPLRGDGEIAAPAVVEMKSEDTLRPGLYRYTGVLRGKATGQHGFRVRILPSHPDLVSAPTMGCITWG